MNYIESKPGVMMGKAVIAGTRITVENILERLGAGETVESIVAELRVLRVKRCLRGWSLVIWKRGKVRND